MELSIGSTFNHFGGVVFSDSFTIISRILVSGQYPANFLSDHELTCYLHLLCKIDKDFGTTYVGRNDYRKYAGFVYSHIYKRAVGYLESQAFIKATKRTKTRTYYDVNVPPIYDKKNDYAFDYYQKRLLVRHLWKLKHYCILIPNRLITEEMILNNRMYDTKQVNVLLKLYRYNFLSAFGGVDFNLIHKENGIILMENRLFEDIHLIEKDFVTVIESLRTAGLINWVDVVVSDEVVEFETLTRYVCDHKDYVGSLDKHHRIISIIRPVHQVNPQIFKKGGRISSEQSKADI